MNGPIWKDAFDVEKGEMCTGIDIVDGGALIGFREKSREPFLQLKIML